MKSQPFQLQNKYKERLKETVKLIPQDYIYIDTNSQELLFVRKSVVSETYPVSTSKYGLGNREDSFKTPEGIHRITDKIGSGAPLFRIFESREDTGINWSREMNEGNIVLTRILRLEGIEPGKNRGRGIDSYERYIYIHGTNREDMIGKPMSHGCVCMKNNDIVKLFDMVEEGTLVIIS